MACTTQPRSPLNELTTPQEILAASTLLSQRLQSALAPPSLPSILRLSQWRCLARSYSAVTQALTVLFDRACPTLDQAPDQEILHGKLIISLQALYQAVEEGERCMQESQLPSSSSSSLHSWLVEKALKQGMCTDVVDVHLHRLLWTSSVVREQILRAALDMDGRGLVTSELANYKNLCEIWEHMAPQDDFRVAETLLEGIIKKCDEDGETATCQLASFILQKLTWVSEKTHRIRQIRDLPPFLWVDSERFRDVGAKILGKGSNGKVYAASWLGARFAVKDFLANNVELGREVTIQAQALHPNIVPLVCCTSKTGLVMEFMQKDLRALLLQRMEDGMDPPFSLLDAIDLMLQIAQGMEYLHSSNIVHRDLKSFNILVSFPDEGDVTSHVHLKIADFGTSKAKARSSKYVSRPIGTTWWMAPEIREINGHYTKKADVYSFALVCFEILTGETPFQVGDYNIRQRVRGGERPKLPLHCPQALSSFIKQCWHEKPADRPTFTQVCRVLRHFKACILLRDHEHDEGATRYHNWLLHPLDSPAREYCARIDGMVQTLVEHSGAPYRDMLAIPLEMYCCRTVFGGFGDAFEAVLNSLREGGESLSHAVSLGREFTYEELCIATKDFTSRIGESRFFLGELRDGQIRIAVKVAQKPELQGQKKYWRNYLWEELMIVSKLRHPNIVPLYGWCQRDGGDLLLVYEYMRHGDLGRQIHRPMNAGPVFEWQQRYKAVCQLAAALKYLHQDSGLINGQVVHGDVKIGNILLDDDFNACLGDCGLAVLLEGSTALERVHAAGTRGYLAPESRSGGSRIIVSAPSDMYSFGVTVIEIVSGRRPDSRSFEDNVGTHVLEEWADSSWSFEDNVGTHVLEESADSRSFEDNVGTYVLEEWAWELYDSRELTQAADDRLQGNFDRMQMERVLVLGLACTNERPQDRPNIQEVMTVLSDTSSALPTPLARGPSQRAADGDSLAA